MGENELYFQYFEELQRVVITQSSSGMPLKNGKSLNVLNPNRGLTKSNEYWECIFKDKSKTFPRTLATVSDPPSYLKRYEDTLIEH